MLIHINSQHKSLLTALFYPTNYSWNSLRLWFIRAMRVMRFLISTSFSVSLAFIVSTLLFPSMQMRMCLNTNWAPRNLCVKLFMSCDSEAPINHEMVTKSDPENERQNNEETVSRCVNWTGPLNSPLIYPYLCIFNVPFSFLFAFLRFYVAEKWLFTIFKWRACESHKHTQIIIAT